MVTRFIYFVLLSLLCRDAHSAKVQIFKDTKFKGLIFEYQSELANCLDLPGYATGDTGSILTDTCLIIYESSGCTGNSFKLSKDMTDEMENLRRKIYSLEKCSVNLGGDIIQVDMFSDTDLIAKYTDICGCQDLPIQVTTKATGLINYGNCITVYSTDTCSGEDKMDIPGGQNLFSQNLTNVGYYVRSISACGTRPSCVRLDASIYKFEIFIDASLEENQGEMKMGQTTKFFNNGSATLTQEYEAVQTIRETTIVKVSKSIKKMTGHKVVNWKKVDVSVSADIPIPDTTLALSIGVGVGYAASNSFGSGDSEEESESTTHTHVEEKKFTAKQTFQVPPCVEYKVSSIVKMVENYPIIYDTYTQVTGEANGRRLTAQEVEKQVEGMTFVEYLDEFTAVFKSTDTIQANMGVETLITAEGNDIPGCDPNLN